MSVIGIYVAIQSNSVLAGNQHFPGAGVHKAAIAGCIHILREVNVPTQTVIHCEFRGEAPGILNVGEQPVLPLGCSGGVADVTLEGPTHVSEQK